MTARVAMLLALLACALLLAFQGHADVYKCKDTSGVTTYSQTPCDANQTKHELGTVSTKRVDDAICADANEFAVVVAERMRGGVDPAVQIAAYGGLDAISGGTMGIINYVYSFRVSDDVTPVRIGALTQAKCSNGGLGNLRTADIPLPDEEEDADDSQPLLPPISTEVVAAESSLPPPPDPVPQEPVEDPRCMVYRDRVADVDSRMRDAYSAEEGDKLRKQRRRYKTFLAEFCF